MSNRRLADRDKRTREKDYSSVSIWNRYLLGIGYFLLGLVLVSDSRGIGCPPAYGYNAGDIVKDHVEFRLTIDWLNASAQHSPGNRDAAAVFIGSWPLNDLYSVLRSFRKMIKSGEKDIPPELRNYPILQRFLKSQNQSLKRGALLHTDIAILELDTGSHGRYAARQVRVDDGRGTLGSVGVHWDVSRLLLDLYSPEPSLDEMIREWYIATSALMFARRNWASAEMNLSSAMGIFPNNARILFYAGVLHEIYAMPDVQSINAGARRGVRANVESKKSELKYARKLFNKSKEIDPEFAEVHLHLGRVMGLLGDHDKAIAELRQAQASVKGTQLQYYCSLYLGCEHVILDQREEARMQFERAATLYPNAQSPLLSLSQLARSSGDFENAFLAVQKVFKLPTGGEAPEDPWLIYDASHVHDLSSLLLKMYRAFGVLKQ